jgi:hypothetical protein
VALDDGIRLRGKVDREEMARSRTVFKQRLAAVETREWAGAVLRPPHWTAILIDGADV